MKKLLFLFALVSLIGCQTSQVPSTSTDITLPDTWVAQPADRDSLHLENWVAAFEDSTLNALVREALGNNLDLQVAAAEVARATAVAKLAGVELFPVVDVSLDGKRTDFGQAGVGQFFGGPVNEYGASLNVSWEIDVWKRIRNGRNADTYEYYAYEYDFTAAQQSLVAQTVKAYFLAVDTRQRLELARNFANNLQQTHEVTTAFYEEGLNDKQDVHVVSTDFARAKESIQNAESAHRSAVRSLEVLLRRYPSGTMEVPVAFPEMPAPVPAGVPSEVLERRPDIQAAERRVAAAFYRTAQAKAAKLPTLKLTGSIGQNSQELSKVTDPASMIWNVAGNLLFPMFNAGKLNAEIDIKTAEQKNAVTAYQQTALSTFQEVEAALTDEQLFRTRQEHLQTAYTNATEAEHIANENYRIGEIELIDLLRIKGNTISTNMDRVAAQRELLDKWVDLHLALGAGLGDLKGASL